MKSVLPYSLLLVFFTVQVAASPLVSINKETVSVEEFNKKYNGIKESSSSPPSPESFLNELINYKVTVAEAKKQGILSDPTLKEAIEREVFKIFIEKKLGKKLENVKVVEKEMIAAHRKSPPIEISQILIRTAPNANKNDIATQYKRAQSIYGKIVKSKKRFFEHVKLYTDDTISKKEGGRLGVLFKHALPKNVYNAAIKLKVGQISKPIQTRYGFHIIKLENIITYKNTNKTILRQVVESQKKENIFAAYFKKIKRNHSVKINKKGLKKIK